MRRVEDPRSGRISFNATSDFKARLMAIAKERDISLSLLVYGIVQQWLEQQAPVEEDKNDRQRIGRDPTD